MKRYLIHLVATLLVAAAVATLVVVSGVAPIKASSGHWPITKWLLNFSKRRSVATHSLGIEAPALDEPRLIVQGAAAFEMNCSWCHGSPRHPRPRVAAAMTATPPYLPDRVAQYDAAELFYITKHGIKFTGMPAWPTLKRDDEVWAVTAFLLKLPEMDAAEYRRLAFGSSAAEAVATKPEPGPPESPAAAALATCRQCHGYDGKGRGLGAFPKLAGQRVEYLRDSLTAYAKGHRRSGVMEPIAARLTSDEIDALATYYAELPRMHPIVESADNQVTAASLERGKQIASQGLPKQLTPPCAECHHPESHQPNPHYPILAGQYASYLELQLELFANRRRGGTEFAHLMHQPADELNDRQRRDVASWFASLKPDSTAMPDAD